MDFQGLAAGLAVGLGVIGPGLGIGILSFVLGILLWTKIV